MEIEHRDEKEKLHIPDQIHVLREVTEDIDYKNVSLAKNTPGKRRRIKKQGQLYAVTDSRHLGNHTLAEAVEQVLKNGAALLQYREKQLSYEERLAQVLELQKVAGKYHVPLIINDDVRLAKEADADGVHLGQKDMAYQEAREILGAEKIIGMTAPSVELAREAERLGADYIGAGAVFSTETKQDTSPLSVEQLKGITEAVSIPVFAIGGICAENIVQLQGTGIAGAAVVSAIFGQADPGAAAKKLVQLLQKI